MEQENLTPQPKPSRLKRWGSAIRNAWQRFRQITLRDGNPATEKHPDYSHCLNCGAELAGMFCHKCGQRAIQPAPKIWEFVWEYFRNVLSIERQTLPTLCNLVFHPAHLIKDYYAGRRVSYLHPLKLNIMFLVIMITLFALFGTDTRVTNSFSDITQNQHFTSALIISSLSEDEATMEQISLSPRDTILLRSHHTIFEENPKLIQLLEIVQPENEENIEVLRVVAPRWLIEQGYLNADMHQIHDFMQENLDEFSRDLMLPELSEAWIALFSNLFKHLPLLMLLTAPFLVGATRLLFKKRCASRSYYYIYAFYYLAFIELILILFYILGVAFDFGFIEIRRYLIVIITLYLTITLKKIFDLNSWFKALLSSIVVNIVYLMTCAMIIAIISIFAILSVAL